MNEGLSLQLGTLDTVTQGQVNEDPSQPEVNEDLSLRSPPAQAFSELVDTSDSELDTNTECVRAPSEAVCNPAHLCPVWYLHSQMERDAPASPGMVLETTLKFVQVWQAELHKLIKDHIQKHEAHIQEYKVNIANLLLQNTQNSSLIESIKTELRELNSPDDWIFFDLGWGG